MKAELWNLGMNQIDPALLEEHLAQKEKYAKANKRRRLIGWASAACAVLVALAVGLPWVMLPFGAVYTAEEIGKIFGVSDTPGTNAYQEVFAPGLEYMNIGTIPKAKVLPVYGYMEPYELDASPDRDEFEAFLDAVYPKLARALGGTLPEYEIIADNNSDYLGGEEWIDWTYLRASNENIGRCSVSASQTSSEQEVSIHQSIGDGIALDGKAPQIEPDMTDEDILAALDGCRQRLFDIFGVTFADAFVDRIYFADSPAPAGIQIYYYDEDAHPLNESKAYVASDYIYLSVRFEKKASYGETEEYRGAVAHIAYKQNRVRATKIVPVKHYVKMISLKEAEALLDKGYVFGGHSCSLCMAEQEKVSFENYDFAGFEYLFDSYPQITTGIPFYTFYKQIGTAQNGNLIYAKTYVPAIEISGYEEYFEGQEAAHRAELDFTEIE